MSDSANSDQSHATIVALSPTVFSAHCPSFVDIYIEAMGYNPAIRDSRIHAWRSAVQEQGFLAYCALDDDLPVGVAYGFLGRREHWWDHQVRRGIRELHGYSSPLHKVLHNYFQLAEIHTHPAYQGKGIGDALLSHIEQHHLGEMILLSTPEVAKEENRAFQLYRRHGYHDILRNFRFQGDIRPFAVLGK